MSIQETLGNKEWLTANTDKIKNILPETWTHVGNLNGVKIGFDLKLLGIDWRSAEEFGRCMMFFERAGLMWRKGLLIRRSN